jgi:hypothetical protein
MSEMQQKRRLIPPARRMPLEEATASVDFPVYGLARPIHDFQTTYSLLFLIALDFGHVR